MARLTPFNREPQTGTTPPTTNTLSTFISMTYEYTHELRQRFAKAARPISQFCQPPHQSAKGSVEKPTMPLNRRSAKDFPAHGRGPPAHF